MIDDPTMIKNPSYVTSVLLNNPTQKPIPHYRHFIVKAEGWDGSIYTLVIFESYHA